MSMRRLYRLILILELQMSFHLVDTYAKKWDGDVSLSSGWWDTHGQMKWNAEGSQHKLHV